MKLLTVLLATAWLVLAAIPAAHAGPVVAALGALGTFLSSGTLLAQIVVGALLTAARIGIGLLTKAKDTNQTAGVNAQVQVGGDNPMSFIMGHFATAGQREYINTWGKSGKTPNAYLTQVISLGDLPVGALTGLWVGDQKVTVPDMSGAKPYPQGWSIQEFEYEDGGTNHCLWINFHDGTETTADQFLIDTFGGDPDRPWASDMIGRGVPYAIVTAEVNNERFSGIPTFIFETDGIPLYDVSKDTTAGGSGAHRYADPSTWEPSDNTAVQIYNILRGIRYAGTWLWGGQTIAANQLPAANWIAAISACNAAVDLADGGTEPAYRSGGEITVDKQPLDVIDSLLAGASARMAEIGGIYKILVGAPGAAVYSYDTSTIVVSEPQTIDPFPGLDQTYNGAQASYPEPAEKWQSKDAPGYFRADLEALDDDRRLVEGIQYPYTPYAVQVQRLLQAAVEDARRFRHLQHVLPPEAFKLEPLDVVAFTDAGSGFSDKKFIVEEIDGDSAFLQYVSLKEIDPADYSWDAATDERAVSVGFLAPIRPAAQAIVDFSASAASVNDNAGEFRRPAIQLAWDGDVEDVRGVQYEVRLAPDTGEPDGSGDLVYAGQTEQVSAGAILISQGILAETDYQVRGKYIPGGYRETLWSGWLNVTTGDIRFNTVDLVDNAITAAKLADAAVTVDKLVDGAVVQAKIADAAVTANKLLDGAVSSVKLADQAVTTAKLQVAAVTGSILADAAVSTAKFAAGLTPIEIVSSLPTTGNFEGRQAYNTSDGLLYTYTGGDWEATVGSGSIADGSITSAKLADAAVTASKLLDGAVSGSKIQAGAVGATQIAAGSITASKLTLVDTSNMNADPFFADHAAWSSNAYLSALRFVDASLSQCVTLGVSSGVRIFASDSTGQYVAITSGSGRLVPVEQGAILRVFARARVSNDFTGACYVGIGCFDATGAYTTSLSVPGTDFTGGAPGAFTTDVIEGQISLPAGTAAISVNIGVNWGSGWSSGKAGDAVFSDLHVMRAANASMIVDGSIIAGKIAAGAVTASTVATNAITTGSIQAGAVNTAQLASSAITSDKIAAGAVTASTIGANAVTAAKIAANAVTAVAVQAGSITGDKVAASTITGANMVAGTLTAREVVITNSNNLLRNPDFTGSGAGWLYGQYFDPGAGSNGADYGRNSLRNDGRNVARSDFIQVSPGDSLFVSAYTYNARPGALALSVVTYDAAQAVVAYNTVASYTGGGWQLQSGSFTVPAGISYVSLLVFSDTASGSYPGQFSYVAKPFMMRRADASLIVDGAISAAKMAANSIVATSIASGAVTAGKIGALAITSDKIASNAVTADKIAANAITAGKISVGSLDAISATLGSVDISDATIGTLTVGTSNIEANAVTGSATASASFDYHDYPGAAYETLDSVTISNVGGLPMLMQSILSVTAVGGTGSGNYSNAYIRVINYTTGAVIKETFVAVGQGGSGSNSTDTFAIDDSAVAGDNTYFIQAKGHFTSNGCSGSGTLRILTWKR